MAKYEVTHTCSHTVTHVLFGKHEDRERKLAWLETTLCRDCFEAKLEEDRDNASRLCHEWSKTEGLSPLLGTPKQIAWAETLGAGALGNARAEADRIKRILDSADADPAALAAVWAAVIDAITWLSQQDEAKFWIDHREIHPLELILICPYLAPHLELLLGPRQAAARREADQARAAEALKVEEEKNKKVKLQQHVDADRAESARLFGGTGLTISVKSDERGRRVFLGGYPAFVTFYADGDRYHPKGSIEIGPKTALRMCCDTLALGEDDARKLITDFCVSLAAHWKSVQIG